MNRLWSALALLLFAPTLALQAACSKDEPLTVRDSEGRSFSAKCKDQSCKLELLTGPPSPEQKPELQLQARGRIVGVCNTGAGAAVESSADCRALTCNADGDCPDLHGPQSGSCVNKLCTEPTNDLISDDAVMLCLSGTGVGQQSPRQVERYAMALNCGSPCKVPSPCRQP